MKLYVSMGSPVDLEKDENSRLFIFNTNDDIRFAIRGRDVGSETFKDWGTLSVYDLGDDFESIMERNIESIKAERYFLKKIITLDDEDFKIITYALFLLQNNGIIEDNDQSAKESLTLRKVYNMWEEIKKIKSQSTTK